MSQQIETHVLAKYKVLKKIGSGAYGHVFKVIQRKTKKIKALKKNFDAFINSTDAQRTYRQIMFLFQLKHPNIIVMDEVIQASNGKDIYLVFQFMDADLHMLIRQNILEQKHKKYIIYQIAKALLYLHSGGLIHRDLKPSNILLNEACDTKLCDFGLVRSVDDGARNQDDNFDILTEYIATRWYRAPEILLASKSYSKQIDIWGFGCLIAELMKGKPIFPGTSTINQLERILAWTGQPSQSDIQALQFPIAKQIWDIVLKSKRSINRKQFFHQINHQCFELISRCLEFNPKKRITIEQILKHPYLSQYYVESTLIVCENKVKIPIDDNRRLSLKDYRLLIYQQIEKSKNNQEFMLPFTKSIHQQILVSHSKDKPKQTIKTEQSDYIGKQTIKCQPQKKLSGHYENESKTVSIKKQNMKKKTFYKGQSLYQKNLKILSSEDHHRTNKSSNKQRQKQKQRERQKQQQKLKKLKQQIYQSRKVSIFKQSNHCTKRHWKNKVKRSITEGDHQNYQHHPKQSKMFTTHLHVANFVRN